MEPQEASADYVHAPTDRPPSTTPMRLLILGFTLTIGLFGCGGSSPAAPVADTPTDVGGDQVILEGTIRRFTTDQLLGGVMVLADQASVTSTEKGSYTFTDLGEGEVQIRATYPGFLPYSAKQRLQPGRNRHDIDLVPERQR